MMMEMRSRALKVLFFTALTLSYAAVALSIPTRASTFKSMSKRMTTNMSSQLLPTLMKMRGGEVEVLDFTNYHNMDNNNKNNNKNSATSAAVLTIPLNTIQSLGSLYSSALVSRPILTKSLTAAITFGLSDFTAQKIEQDSNTNTNSRTIDWTRTLTSTAVGLFYFGPAAHVWYEWIFKLLPSTSLFSTLQKAALGQLIFGPVFTCIFFATSLMQAGDFTLSSWVSKIKNDLPTAWLAGVGFWPLVDFVSYALVPLKFIPLFINLCSFVWTIYLSMVANRQQK